MKKVSDKYREGIKTYGRQIDVIITYTDEEGEHLLDSDVLFSVIPTVNGNILKSVMKQLEFESSVAVPKNTIINVKFGIQVDMSLTLYEVDNMKLDRLNNLPLAYFTGDLKGFEYINLGNYIVSKEPEYNADTLSYSHLCYDKMLYSMKDCEELQINYPITVRSYIDKICSHLGLAFKDKNNTFANYDKLIQADLYRDYGYTFRDILDELAQVTASTICINEDTDELEIRYINETNDTIDEDYLKDKNVGFSEVYGPINSIVLSRAAESDNVFLQDEQSITDNGLCEIKIVDNQIMNNNDRSDYLPDILEKLNGLSYYINDFDSPGVTWYELCDKYNVKIYDKTYSCILLNDEIKITGGLEETIYTEMPEVSKTDYDKADKTDRKINKAYIMVDKQNQKIEAVIGQQTETSQKVTQVEQTLNSISSKVQNIEEFSREVTSMNELHLADTAKGNNLVLTLKIYGDTQKFKVLTPSETLAPSETLVPLGDAFDLVIDTQSRANPSENAIIHEIQMPEPLRNNGNIRDELNIVNGKVTIIRRIGNDGSILAKEVIEEYGDINLETFDKDTYIYIREYPNVEYFCRYVIKNDYLDTFATQQELQEATVELNSLIEQKQAEITLLVSRKVGKDEVISSINMSPEKIKILARLLELEGYTTINGGFKVDEYGNMEAVNGRFTGGNMNLYSSRADDSFPIFSVQEGNQITYIRPDLLSIISDKESENYFSINIIANNECAQMNMFDNNGNTCLISPTMFDVTGSIYAQSMHAHTYDYDSKAELKENIKIFNKSALELINNSDIYQYKYKSISSGQTIGLVIGEGYKTPKEVISNGDGINSYSMNGLSWKAIQELDQKLEKLLNILKKIPILGRIITKRWKK